MKCSNARHPQVPLCSHMATLKNRVVFKSHLFCFRIVYHIRLNFYLPQFSIYPTLDTLSYFEYFLCFVFQSSLAILKVDFFKNLIPSNVCWVRSSYFHFQCHFIIDRDESKIFIDNFQAYLKFSLLVFCLNFQYVWSQFFLINENNTKEGPVDIELRYVLVTFK